MGWDRVEIGVVWSGMGLATRLLIMIKEIKFYASPKLSRYTTALCTYNSKSFTYQINKRTHARTHAHTHTYTHTHTRARARTHGHVIRNSHRGKHVRETRVEG